MEKKKKLYPFDCSITKLKYCVFHAIMSAMSPLCCIFIQRIVLGKKPVSVSPKINKFAQCYQ